MEAAVVEGEVARLRLEIDASEVEAMAFELRSIITGRELWARGPSAVLVAVEAWCDKWKGTAPVPG